MLTTFINVQVLIKLCRIVFHIIYHSRKFEIESVIISMLYRAFKLFALPLRK